MPKDQVISRDSAGPDTGAVHASTAIEDLHGVGPVRAQRLARLGIAQVRDLLLHLPVRYEDWRDPVPIAQLAEGGPACIRASISGVRLSGWGRTARVTARLRDSSGSIAACWFAQGYIAQSLRDASEPLLFLGTVKENAGTLQIVNPRIMRATDSNKRGAGLVPVYPATEGLAVSTIRGLIATALSTAVDTLPEAVPAPIRRRLELPSMGQAIRTLHAPESSEAVDRARRRLAFEELLVLQVALGVERGRREGRPAQKFGADRAIEDVERAMGLFATDAQRRAFAQIAADLERGRPMARLLQGDVGSGKTLVALAALAAVCRAGRQGALMAPTEVLAEQHFLSIEPVCKELGIEVVLVTGRQTQAARAQALDRLARPAPVIAIGTHALIEDHVRFACLALVVIDEQHRFGVLQRDRLLGKGVAPHLLVMTATPIPRTLTLTLYGDLDVTLIDALPAGRSCVKTIVVAPSQLDAVWRAVDRRVSAGQQAFVVCPLFEQGQAPALANVAGLAQALTRGVFSARCVASLWGPMPVQDKRRIMDRLRAGDVDVLVATPVIEVGVDVPNATAMVVMDAESFGLAQLHQLRGRIGRGREPGICYLVARTREPEARRRLNMVAATHDGLSIAREDALRRGPGEIFGTRQSGPIDLRLADPFRQFDILVQAREEADRILREDPDLIDPEHAPLAEQARARALRLH